MISRNFRIQLVALVFGFFLMATSVHATVFSWGVSSYSSDTWAGGAPAIGTPVTNTYNNDSSHAGNDISVSLSQVGSTAAAFTGGFPTVNNTTYATKSGAVYALVLKASLDPTTDQVMVTIDFSNYSGGVQNVSFTLYNVDGDGVAGPVDYKDKISQILGTTTTGGTIAASTITVGAGNKLFNTGTNAGTAQYVEGTGDKADNVSDNLVNISFSGTAVSSISFVWSNSGGTSNAGIGFGDVTYTGLAAAAPEVHPGLAAALVCGVALFARKIRRRVA